MTVVTPERALEILVDLDGEWTIACDMLSKWGQWGFPVCKGAPAAWVAWRGNCCSQSPRYYLLCSYCKGTYERWYALHAHMTCAWCGDEVEILNYQPLRKA